MIQAADGQRVGPRRRRRRRLGRARSHRPGAVPPEVQDAAGRSRSTSAGSTRTRAAASSSRTSSATPPPSRGASTWCSIGSAILEVPKHPRIHHLGFLDDRDKFDALAASDLLIMPSYFESLSMVALEAWALGRPVLANAQLRRAEGPVHPEQRRPLLRDLRGVRRGALFPRIERPAERRLGRNGREFFKRNYAWPVIERKYLDMFAQLEERSAAYRRQLETARQAGSTAARVVRAPEARSAAGA